jgi:hypothetical protein
MSTKQYSGFARPLVPAVWLSFRDLEEMMAERNLRVDHVTIWRWVQRYAPVEPSLPSGITPDPPVVEGRRDVLAGGGRVDLLISRGGFGRSHN